MIRSLPITLLLIGLLYPYSPQIQALPMLGGIVDPARYVDLFAGTAGLHSHNSPSPADPGDTNPGAAVPFGMVQWGPDTMPGTANPGGGYAYGDSSIRGFSLTHLSGVGCPIFGDIPFLPVAGSPFMSPARFLAAGTPYSPSFSHRDEWAAPGYYRLRLGSGITVELTATTRSGAARLTYPAGSAGSVLIDAGGSLNGDTAAQLHIDPAHTLLTGAVSSGNFCFQHNHYTLYFAATFSRPFVHYGTWNGMTLLPGAHDTVASTSLPVASLQGFNAGVRTGAYLTFATRRYQTVEIRVGLSYIGVKAALANLHTENPGLPFDRVRARAHTLWNDLLSRVQVRGGSSANTLAFYTMLYHALLQPSIFGDADGRYRGFDDRIHQARGYTQYANFSGWDIYRTEIPLLALLAPRQTGDMVRSLLADAAQDGGCLPKWPVANGNTAEMVGDPADPIIAGAYALGVRSFDPSAALHALIAGASCLDRGPNGYVERPGGRAYRALGYVPADLDRGFLGPWLDASTVWGAASTTLEYAIADFAISRLAVALGHLDRAATFLRLATNWRLLFDPATGLISSRRANGSFVHSTGPAGNTGFVEGTAAHYTWAVPYDLHGLAAAMGGPTVAARRLAAFLARFDDGPSGAHVYLGNEPSLGTPWIFDFLGRPWQTQQTVRRALLDLYSAAPSGYPGNDDLGTLSAWYVFGALGLYPAIPGVGGFALGSPLFPRITLRLAAGTLEILAPAASDSTPYVHHLTLNGYPYNSPWLPFAAVSHGARLLYTLGAHPATRWGSDPALAPPSFPPPP